jgi:hypothetical protein
MFYKSSFQGCIPLQKNRKVSVSEFFLNNIETQFHLPLSEQAYQEYQALQDYIQTLQVQPNTKDFWHYIW